MESIDEVVARCESALGFVGPGRLFLNPDCGFGTFSTRPMNTADRAEAKLGVLARAAIELRQRHSLS